jgi:hypothetical protein
MGMGWDRLPRSNRFAQCQCEPDPARTHTRHWVLLLAIVMLTFVLGFAAGSAAEPATSVSVTWPVDQLRQEARINGRPIHVASQPLILTVADGAPAPTVEVRSCVAQTSACGPWRTVKAGKN